MTIHRPPAPPAPAGSRAAWALLAVLLAATLAGAVTFDRAAWPGFVGDEATYAMQAESLAFDFDLAYGRGDYDRFVAHWGRAPEGLVLQSADRGGHITFGKTPLYALVLAPVVRWAPVRGPAVVNALLLALAAVAAARVLGRRLGAAAPLWVAVACFASVTFAYVFWIHADLFLACATALGFALAYRGAAPPPAAAPRQVYEPPGGAWEAAAAWRPLARWVLAGALLAVPGTFRPFYLALLAPALVAAAGEAAAAGERRWRRPAALLAGALVLLAATAAVQRAAGGAWSAYGAERQGFYERTGFPDVDFPARGWEASIERWGNSAWLYPGALGSYGRRWDASLWGWNALYFLVGRDVGVLPYFLPLVLAFAAADGRRGRWLLPAAVLLAAAAFFVVRPFNFYGGTGALANRYFLPLYPALWFLAARPPAALGGGGRRALAALAVALLAAPFLWPLWRAPRAFPVGPDGRYAYVSPVAQRWLPYETTQSHLPGGHDRTVDGLWVRLLGGGIEPVGEHALRLTGGGRPATLLVASPRPLLGLSLVFDARGPNELEVEGGTPTGTLVRPDGGIAFLLHLDAPRAVHPMWWSEEDWTLYELTLTPGPSPGGPMPMTLAPFAGDGAGATS